MKQSSGMFVQQLNDARPSVRMQAIEAVGKLIQSKQLQRDVLKEVNNHVHTTYSFSPYQPAAAAFEAWKAGLGIVGAVDHDSMGGALEMLEASQAFGLGATVGFEVRTSLLDSPFANRKINNPDSEGIIYMCVHGVPRNAIAKTQDFLAPIRLERSKRNKKQTEQLNTLLAKTSLDPLDYDTDVVPLSLYNEGGTVTERHILSALVKKILKRTGKGEPFVRLLQTELEVSLTPQIQALLLDPTNIHYEYDALGVLKSELLNRFFIQPNPKESIPTTTVLAYADSIGAISAYAYLGDITFSVTADKRAEHFEDSFLDELIPYLAQIGFKAVTYMPPRNTKEQMARVQQLCRQHTLMQISGVDINSSRQTFNCPELLDPQARHLIDAAWALVAHEKLVDYNADWGLFSANNPLAFDKRIATYAALGQKMDCFHPESIIDLATKELR
ncbi:MAG: PHP domain-containing protein [Sphaerochaetaceae bacterium]